MVLILIKTNGTAKSIIITDPRKIYVIFISSIIIPPTIVPMNMAKLHNNRNIPFANSGDWRREEVTQYCETVYADPSNIPKIKRMHISANG